ncbi:MAG: DUF1073 domain-containing protein [Nitrosopumilaceae archaeon]|jgi:phage-related protein (TIGR01555 family)
MVMEALRTDGWSNLIAGIGVKKKDKTENTYFVEDYILEDEDLSALYDGEGLAANIIDAVPDDMTRAGWTIANDEKEKIQNEMKRIKAVYYLNKALKYARLYRGAIVVMITERGELDKPIPANPGNVKRLRVYSAKRIILTSTDIVEDPNSEYFDDVEIFHVLTRSGKMLDIHRSRCLWFGGELVSDDFELDLTYQYWGLSTMQRIWARLKNYGAVERAVANLLLEFNLGIYEFSNLAEILAMNKEEMMSAVYTRLEAINACKSMLNAVMIGEGESFTRDSANLSGLADIIDRMMINLTGVAKIPATKLFRRSPAGMNATGESDITNYYDDVSTQQTQKLEPELQKLINVIGKAVYGSNKENKYTITFNSLWEPTEKEKAETKKLNAETHSTDIANQVIDAEESRKIRYPDLEV